MFKQAKKHRVFQNVIEQVEDAILQGKLKVGDKLPPERELTEILGVSRGTVREALRVLEEKGLIQVKTGAAGGAVVSSMPARKVAESLARLIRSEEVSMSDIAEFRVGVEGIVASLASSRATKDDIDRLTSILVQARECVRKGLSSWNEFISLDNNLHRCLAQIAGNKLYELVLDSVHENISRYYDRLLKKKAALMRENLKDLEDLVEAVSRGEADAAMSIAQDHVRRFDSYMERREKP